MKKWKFEWIVKTRWKNIRNNTCSAKKKKWKTKKYISLFWCKQREEFDFLFFFLAFAKMGNKPSVECLHEIVAKNTAIPTDVVFIIEDYTSEFPSPRSERNLFRTRHIPRYLPGIERVILLSFPIPLFNPVESFETIKRRRSTIE